MTPAVPRQQHPPQPQNMNPPDKVMFPPFAPQIPPDDPRLIQFAENMRKQILKCPKNIDPRTLEFEAKLGQIIMNDPFR